MLTAAEQRDFDVIASEFQREFFPADGPAKVVIAQDTLFLRDSSHGRWTACDGNEYEYANRVLNQVVAALFPDKRRQPTEATMHEARVHIATLTHALTSTEMDDVISQLVARGIVCIRPHRRFGENPYAMGDSLQGADRLSARS